MGIAIRIEDDDDDDVFSLVKGLEADDTFAIEDNDDDKFRRRELDAATSERNFVPEQRNIFFGMSFR